MTHIQCFALCSTIYLATWAICQSIWDLHDTLNRLYWATEGGDEEEYYDEADYDEDWGM